MEFIIDFEEDFSKYFASRKKIRIVGMEDALEEVSLRTLHWPISLEIEEENIHIPS